MLRLGLWSKKGARSLAIAALLSLGAATGFAACGEESAGLCEPGTEVFCKCKGGFDGTKTCGEDGATFGPCTTEEGECPEIGSSSATGKPQECEPDSVDPCTCDDGMTLGEKTCDSEGEGFGPCLVSGAECAAAGTKGFFEPCTLANECLSGICEGFCTRTCATYQDCIESDDVYGDCVDFGSAGQLCAQYCFNQEDCGAFGYAEDVLCGGTTDVNDPSFVFAACGRWPDGVSGYPYGTACDEAAGTVLVGDGQDVPGACHLGLAGVQNVCDGLECVKGCYEHIDCPQMDCSAMGGFRGCCESDLTGCM